MLTEYRARPLYQPLSRSGLIQLLSDQPILKKNNKTLMVRAYIF